MSASSVDIKLEISEADSESKKNKKNKPDMHTRTYTVVSAPVVKGLVFMQ